ncbi:MAG: serine hydroxymethyltransferase [Candidatus Woykebacteria bacterium GWB1_45_5]|uniref:Serine hydroxymethyltransferase n=2 Tax=Candidatus Woykeibacteriota TaxID=1817899 RepID=A0A1G1W3G7_9BACT|nr:MAG: serine hydroxymethyltransferase [Candidatus Woykebacteria bacterium GWA1_44_8]OGY23810.1 MAG: serine hydroxymethyltransferase [Candidatus Woykebacteria bacterium GWB1_45_5]
MKSLKDVDKKVAELIKKEEKRQRQDINLIPSENYTSRAVREALGSVFTNKYSEGYPFKRYYAGNKFVDEVESLAIERAKKLFGVGFANVQGLSGSPANMAAYLALAEVGDTIMGMSLVSGGHLTHGSPVSFSGKLFNAVSYTVDPKTELIDFNEVAKLAKKHRPKIIVCGFTAYPRIVPWKKFREVADSVGAYLLADIAHIAGLIVAGVHTSPVGVADVVTTTTHKTLRGPRGAIIMTNNEELAQKIDKTVFPGLQGGPHDNTTAAIAVALKEASTASFKKYGVQIVKNAKVLASFLSKNNLRLVSGGTDTHLMLVDFGEKGPTGKEVQEALNRCGIVVNKNTVPRETRKPFVTSGIRLGTPAVTTRGMKEKEMEKIGNLIADIIGNRAQEKKLKEIAGQIKLLTTRFPVP